MKTNLRTWRLPIILTIIVLSTGTRSVSAAGPIDFVPAPNRVDMVEDTARNILYISSTDGNLLRYNLTSKSFLDPIVLGGTPYGMDISPDGNTLVVASRPPQVGDVGTIVFAYDLTSFAVECVNDNGMTVWLADFFGEELELVQD